MNHKIIAIDQSTSATKAMLFTEHCELVNRVNLPHQQYYPKPGWVEHDAEEIYENVLHSIALLFETSSSSVEDGTSYSLAITNQRETVVVWNKNTGIPIYPAIVWQCQRGASICKELKDGGHEHLFQEKSGLLLDPYFSASGVKWILDHVDGARDLAENGSLLMGTIDSWLIWKLTGGNHLTDYTNASRTLLFNIHTLDWDDELLSLFSIPRSMMPHPLACDSFFGETSVNSLFPSPIPIAGVLGDSHGALVGQLCFEVGMGKVTYGTGSSVMINVGTDPIPAFQGLVTSIGFSALGQTFYAFEGNIHCTGATIKWLLEKVRLINSPIEVEELAISVPDNGGVYLVPAFAGLGAPWWISEARALLYGMTLDSRKEHILRAALESIAYQVKDLVDMMTRQAAISLKELRVDGGPTKNAFLMQFQSDMLQCTINRSELEEASALGAVIMNGFARKVWADFQSVSNLRNCDHLITPSMGEEAVEKLYSGWRKSVQLAIGSNFH